MSLREAEGPAGGGRLGFGAVKLRFPEEGPLGGWRSAAGPLGGDRAGVAVRSGDGRRGGGEPRRVIMDSRFLGDACGDGWRDLSSRPPRIDAGRGDDLRDGFCEVTADVLWESLSGGLRR